MTLKVRIATCRVLPEPDPDEDALLQVLARNGVEARLAAWDDPAEPWSDPVPTIIRSTWNYIHRLDDFLSWVQAASRAAPIWNPVSVIRWNCHKSYLRRLEAEGIPIVPTAFLDRGSHANLDELLLEHGWNDVVIKPAVSAASYSTMRVNDSNLAAGSTHLGRLLQNGDAMVQNYVPAVETSGEHSIMWIDGEFTHAVRKAPRFGGGDESVQADGVIAQSDRELATRVLAPFVDQILYARVDVVNDRAGAPMLMELELIEPSLYLRESDHALERFGEAIARRIAQAAPR